MPRLAALRERAETMGDREPPRLQVHVLPAETEELALPEPCAQREAHADLEELPLEALAGALLRRCEQRGNLLAAEKLDEVLAPRHLNRAHRVRRGEPCPL